MESKTKKLWVLLGVLVVIVLIIIVAASQGKKKTTTPADSTPMEEAAETTSPTGIAAEEAMPVNEILKDAKVEAPGANPITKDNKVVTLEGKETQNDVAQSSPLAPAETGPVKKEDLAPSVIKIDVSAAGYSPKEFTVQAGAPVTLSITSVDAYAHSFVFADAALSAIGVGVYSNETRAVTFNAPTQAGEYIFYCNVGNHRSRGEEGKMIVK